MSSPTSSNMNHFGLPQLETSFTLSPPGTPSRSSSQSRSSRISLPTSPRDSTCLPQENRRSASLLSVPSQRSTSIEAYSPLRRQLSLPQGPKDYGCPRPQPRQPNRKINLPRSGDSSCPYTVPQRASSVYSNCPSKISKPTSQYVRQHQQHRRGSIASSISSLSSRGSSVASSNHGRTSSSHQQAYRAALLEAQAQMVSIPPSNASRRHTSTSVMNLNTGVSSYLSNGMTPATALSGYYDQHPFQHPQSHQTMLIGASPTELFPLLTSSSSSATSSRASSYACTPEHEQPLQQAVYAEHGYTFLTDNDDQSFIDYFPVAPLTKVTSFPISTDTTEIDMTQTGNNAPTNAHSHPSPLASNPLTASPQTTCAEVSTNYTAASVMPAPVSSKADLDFDYFFDLGLSDTITSSPSATTGVNTPNTPVPSLPIVQPPLDLDTKMLSVPPTPTTSSAATPKQTDQVNGFVAVSHGGKGLLLDTSRLRGRVLRPWN